MAAITTTEAARRMGRYEHQVRRLLDQLEREGRVRVIRLGRVRAVDPDVLPLLEEEMAKRPGWARLETAIA